MPYVQFGLFDRADQIAFALQILNDPSVAMCAQSIRSWGHALIQQVPDLIYEAVLKMLFGTGIYPGVQVITRRVQRQHLNSFGERGGVRSIGAMNGNRFARLQIELNSPLHPR